MIQLTEIFGDIVDNVSAKVEFPTDSKINQVYYIYGNPLEVADRLMNDFKNLKYDKYPMVILFTDITSTRGEIGYDSTAQVRVAIVNLTEQNYRAPKRMEVNFNPILFPIYEALLSEIDNYTVGLWKPFDTGYDGVEHTVIPRLFWGSAETDQKNPFNDRLDAIEIKMNLKIYERNC